MEVDQLINGFYGWFPGPHSHSRQSERASSSVSLRQGRDEVEKGRRPVANGWNKRGRGAVDEWEINGL